ncbi:MAG: DUF4070 domain-containing protein [Verrucomicrobiae bacterium]|nr:DUF4070 domain-containing protein [Verrucomicrobiae bacterium]
MLLSTKKPDTGTELYHRLNREQRLLQPRFWDRCTLLDVNFHPAGMSVAELEAGMRWVCAELYFKEETAARKRRFFQAGERRSPVATC